MESNHNPMTSGYSVHHGGFYTRIKFVPGCLRGGLCTAVLLSAILLTLNSATSMAADPEPLSLAERSSSKRFVIAGGVFFARFNSSYMYEVEGTTERVFVDLEGQLDLPSTELAADLTAVLRVSGRSYLMGHYSRLRRSAERLLISAVVDTGGGLVLAIDAQTSVAFNYDFVDLGYGYAFHTDARSSVLGRLGIHLFHVDSGFSIEGNLSVNGEEYSGKIGDEDGFFFAFPLVGGSFDFQLASKWFVLNSVDFVYLPIGDTQAVALRTRVASRFMISRTVGIQLGLSYNFERVQDKEDDITHEIEFDFSGLTANLVFAF